MRPDHSADGTHKRPEPLPDRLIPGAEPISFSPLAAPFTAATTGHLAVSADLLSASDLAVLFQGLLGTQDES